MLLIFIEGCEKKATPIHTLPHTPLHCSAYIKLSTTTTFYYHRLLRIWPLSSGFDIADLLKAWVFINSEVNIILHNIDFDNKVPSEFGCSLRLQSYDNFAKNEKTTITPQPLVVAKFRGHFYFSNFLHSMI